MKVPIETTATPLGERRIARIDLFPGIEHLPYSIKVLLESAARHLGDGIVTEGDVEAIAAYDARQVGEVEIPFVPGRVLLQD